MEKKVGGKPALRSFAADPAKNTNGNSLLLRLDYKRASILSTGDLNRDSQRALLDDCTAGYLPARRASSVAPMEALRFE